MAKSLSFSVQVSSPELICPAISTPREALLLSNIDDQSGLRNHIPFVHFYPESTAMKGQDPAMLIKLALSKALVYYYPVAGRLRSADKGKLVVECNGEGVIFRHGIADVKLSELRGTQGGLRPGFPQWDMLLVDDVWGSNLILDSPLLRLQVTTLGCGGFVLAYTFNHCICDAYGAFMFMKTTSEFCRYPDQISPSLLPSWGRHVLKPRPYPTISHPHPEYDLINPQTTFTDLDFKRFAQTSVFLSHADISTLKSQFPDSKVPSFDVVAACLWRARTRTLLHPESNARLLFPVDTRFRYKLSLPKGYKPSLPRGYYGSAVVFPCVVAKASEIIRRPLSHAVRLISMAKKGASGDDYRASVLDFIEANGRRGFCSDGAFVVSDMTRLSFNSVDFGWGEALFAGPGRAGTGMVPGMVTAVITHKNEEGVDGVLALVSLPPESLEMFHLEVRREIQSVFPVHNKVVSAL